MPFASPASLGLQCSFGFSLKSPHTALRGAQGLSSLVLLWYLARSILDYTTVALYMHGQTPYRFPLCLLLDLTLAMVLIFLAIIICLTPTSFLLKVKSFHIVLANILLEFSLKLSKSTHR